MDALQLYRSIRGELDTCRADDRADLHAGWSNDGLLWNRDCRVPNLPAIGRSDSGCDIGATLVRLVNANIDATAGYRMRTGRCRCCQPETERGSDCVFDVLPYCRPRSLLPGTAERFHRLPRLRGVEAFQHTPCFTRALRWDSGRQVLAIVPDAALHQTQG